MLDWFNKYVVTQVTQQDITDAGAVPVVTKYQYAGAAWHYDDDSLTRSAQRTWDQWRGFRTVTTQTGAAPDPVTETVVTYFQGMDGDHQSGGGTSPVSLSSSEGGVTVPDSDQFAGMGFEDIVYDGVGGSLVTDTVTTPWTSAATATQSQPSPLPALTAYMTGTQETREFTTLASGGSRESDITYTHDSYGQIASESDVPDTTDPSEDTCTTTSYASNTSSWLLDLPAEVQVVSVPCGAQVSLPSDAVSDKLYFYGGSATNGAPPSTGDLTQTQEATSYNGTAPVYTTESSGTYDEYGRDLTATDADNRTTTTVYTPATGAEPTSISVTDPMQLATTTTYDPARELPLTVTNPAKQVTAEAYDGLGRLTSVWLPTFPAAGPANYKFSYTVSNSAPSVVTTQTMEPAENYLIAETLYDSLGRVVETQDETADGNRDITDTYYNSDGWQYKASNSYYTTGAPSATLVQAEDSEIPSQTVSVYDGAGRVTRQISDSLAKETWETDTAYGGDYSTVSYQNLVAGEPDGGTPETTFTDGRGLTTAIYQYHSGVPDDPSDPASDYSKTSYTYTPAGKLATITDAAGNGWLYGYNLAGDQITQADPDTGNSTSAYDPAGQLMSVTDARDDTTSYVYDLDGRKTAAYDTTGGAAETSADEIASWVYDTVQKGLLSSSTSYSGGNAYTQKVLSYNGMGLPLSAETVIPSTAQTGALAGTYLQAFSYEPTGQLKLYADQAAGGLPEETVASGYNNAGEPTALGSYVSSLSYTELGQPSEYTFGLAGQQPAWETDTYDPQTGALTEAKTVAGSNAVTVDDMHYAYDNVGDVTSEADTPSGGPADVQCFQYDYLGRLSQAWSQGSTGCSSPSQPAEAGAAGPYWESFTYNDENDMTSETSTPASGAAATVTSAYPSPGGVQPHAVSSQQSAGPSGTSVTSYGYDPDGDTTSIASPSSQQSLSWNDQGQLSSVTTSGSNAGKTSYVYGADGDLLLQSDPGSTTLYLGDEQLVLDTATGAVSGTRYYSLGGKTVAARTSAGQVYYLAGDEQGTETVAINASTMAVSQRWFDPYGNQVGAPASSWPGDEGFVGGSADTATGLTDLGAREYNPVEGAFISADALLDPADPQDLNPFAYASDNPSTDEDPTGAMRVTAPGTGDYQPTSYNPFPDNPALGNPDIYGTDVWGPADASGAVRVPVHRDGTSGTCLGGNCESDAGFGGLVDAGARMVDSLWQAVSSAAPGGAGGYQLNLAGDWDNWWDHESGIQPGSENALLMKIDSDIFQAAAIAIPGADAVSGVADAVRGGDLIDAVAAAVRAVVDSCDGGESFTAGTKVLLASGIAVPIASLKPGDKVLATNTKTGKTQAETVAAVLVHHDTDLYDLRVKTAHGTTVIDTTRNHLFWDPYPHYGWIPANHLKPGMHLKTPDGTLAIVVGASTPKVHDGWMWDLTVPGNNDHDFYVVVTTASVLVHNDSCPMIGSNGARFTSQEMGRGKGWRIDAENPNPGGRPGQLHFQDYAGNKYQYNFETGEFEGMPGRLAKTVQGDPQVQRAISKGLQFLGEDG